MFEYEIAYLLALVASEEAEDKVGRVDRLNQPVRDHEPAPQHVCFYSTNEGRSV